MTLKVAYITTIPAPHQVKLAKALNEFVSTKFFFLDNINRNRPDWWKVDLNDSCEIIAPNCIRINSKYVLRCIPDALVEYNPDVVMVAGFSNPASYQVYRWAKKNNKKTAVFTELSRDKEGKIRKKNWVWKILSYLYKDVDTVFACNPSALEQFKYQLGFESKVELLRYATDLEPYLSHELRREKSDCKLFFPNRLTDIYNPIGALETLVILHHKYPHLKMKMNAQGELRENCLSYIKENNIESSVEFVKDIAHWDDLPNEYRDCDILLFPAKFSNGNFTINECMASGMGMVISDKVKGHSDTLEDNVNCFICSEDTKAMASKVELYLLEPSLLEKHGSLNKTRVKHLSVNGTAKEYMKKINDLYHSSI